jgi:predicted HTH transcriptional regulator
MLKPSQFASEIQADDIRDLCTNRALEDLYLDFKKTLFTGTEPRESEIDDLVADVVAFANASGGHIIVGIDESKHRADTIVPMSFDGARKIAETIRKLASAHIRPPIAFLDAVPFVMDSQEKDWIVIVTIPSGQARPHMVAFHNQTRFVIRDGDNKRSMTYDEIRQAFLAGTQEVAIASIYSEIRVVRALLESSAKKD